MRKFNGLFLIIIAAVFALAGCSLYRKPVSGASPMVKVLLYTGSEIVIRPSSSYIVSFDSRKEAGSGPITVEYGGDALFLNGIKADASRIEIYAGGGFVFSGKKYDGSVTVMESNKSLFLINTIDIESYVRGVLPGEISPGWDREALKAQAVVSRTFALYEVVSSRKAGRVFDLYSDTRSQSYDGAGRETESTSAAVDATIGEVVRYGGRVIQAFFHSASGGMTESSMEVFGNYRPYLTPVQSPYSSVYRDDRWETTMQLGRAAAILRLTNGISAVAVTARTESKRIKTVEFSDPSGNKITLQGKDLREMFGANSMKSTRANIRISGDSLVISGAGYGHGVGMGQWDALGMARQGYDYKFILTYFYKGTSVDRIW